LFSSANVISFIKKKANGMGGHVAFIGEMRSTYNILVGKPEEERPFGTHRH
jgi:hypothetical protein